MEYIRFKTGIPGIIPPDCSELIPPPPIEEEIEEVGPTVHGPERTVRGVSKTEHKRRMMPCNKD
jgi:hypothetical protein